MTVEQQRRWDAAVAEAHRYDYEAEQIRQSIGGAFKEAQIADAQARAAAARAAARAIREESAAAPTPAPAIAPAPARRVCADTARRKIQRLADAGNTACAQILSHADKYWGGNVLCAVSDAEEGKISASAYHFARKLPRGWNFSH